VDEIGYWMPVDQYIGGIEHAIMHLLYSRFFTKVIHDLGLTDFKEPFSRLLCQGMVTKDGAKMSKSAGNVVYQTDISNKYGIDTARLFLMSVSSPDKQMEWDDEGVEGSFKFIRKIVNYFNEVKIGKADNKTESKLNKTIKIVTKQIEEFDYNLAIINIRNLFESLPLETSKSVLENSLKLLHPFCPHITEELWHKIGNKNFISLSDWPVADEKKIDENLEKQEKAVEGLIADINNILKIVGEKNKVFIYTIPNEKKMYEEAISVINKKTNLDVSVFSVSDKEKYDPQEKAKKAKPMKPAIYLE
jgi:leucyl-tRNA synthetase